ncbi:unnamed protein product [Hanseniaspora opuntiae]
MCEFYFSTWFLTSLNIVLVPLTNSYIHPDEHYQSLEPLLKFINNGLDENMNNGSITWEYSTLSNLPIRSITILRTYISFMAHIAIFLIPCVPLFYISLDFENIKAKYHSSSSLIKKISQLALLGHVVFNILMLFLMGSLHQSGLVNLTNNPTTLSLINNNDFVFWHTLMPLHWPFYLKIKDKSNLFIHFVDDEAGDNGFRELRLENNFKDTHNLYDFMGVDTNNFMHLINGIKQRKEQDMMSIILVTPSRFKEEFECTKL